MSTFVVHYASYNTMNLIYDILFSSHDPKAYKVVQIGGLGPLNFQYMCCLNWGPLNGDSCERIKDHGPLVSNIN